MIVQQSIGTPPQKDGGRRGSPPTSNSRADRLIRTLIVDDDFRVANLHAAFVERMPGFEVVGRAHTAHEAEKAITQLHPELVLLDVYLPDGNGLELAARLRSCGRPHFDVIVITAAQDASSVQTALRCGAVHYLLKPFAFDDFRDRLRSYAAVRGRFAMLRTMNQDQVDTLVATLRPAQDVKVANPYAPRTLDAVEACVAGSVDGVTADELAGRMGLSRATAQRHLVRLAEIERATIRLRYRSVGRPEHVYRALPRPR